MRQARAGLAALVDAARERSEALGRVPPRPRAAPGLGDERRARVVQLGERADMSRRVDDDLLALERRVEVRARPGPTSPACPARGRRAARRPRAACCSSRPSQNGQLSSSSGATGSSRGPALRRGAGPGGRDEPPERGPRSGRGAAPAQIGVALGSRGTAVRGRSAPGRRSSSTAGDAELDQRLQVAQLERDRVLLDHERGVLQPLGGLELALGGDDLRAPLALGLGLARHRALHAGRDLDVLDLDDRDLDAPRARSPRR